MEMSRALHGKIFARTVFLTGSSLAAFIAMASPAYAQDPPAPATSAEATEEDIIVTGTLRESTIQDVPFSINAQTERDIERSGATTIEDISRNVAGLSVQNLGPGQSQVSIRGVSAGQIIRDQPGVKEQVGVYLDDSVISLSLFNPDLDLFDLNRVETLRGPQGTLFGSGSVGGTIRYITNQPRTDRVEGVIEANGNVLADGGTGGHLKGAFNLPISDKLAIRMVGYATKYAGYIDALNETTTQEDDVNDGTRVGGRLSILFQPSENVSITPRVVYQEVRADGFNRQEVYNLYANPFNTTRRAVTFNEREQYLRLDEAFKDDTFIADLTAKIGLGGVELTSITSYIDRSLLISRDASALTGSVSVDLSFPAAGVLLPSNLVDTTELETFTQELRLASDRPGPFQWLLGAFYSKVDRFYTQRLPTPGYDLFTDARFGAGTSVAVANGFPLNSPYNADLPYDIKQIAIFGEASYDLTERLTATAGLRYFDFKEERSFSSGGLFSNGDNQTDKTKSDGFSPRVLLSYEASDNVTLNAQASKGFRMGGANDPLNLGLCGPTDAATFGGFPTYDDEILWNYEAGVKSQFRNITFNAAAYYTNISNLQITADAGSCSSRVVFNADAHTMGLEFELAAQPVEGLDLSLAGSWVEAEFDETRLTATGDILAGIREGNRLPSVPNFQLAASAFYTTSIADNKDLYMGATFQHVGSRYTQAADQEINPRTFIHNLPFGGQAPGSSTTLDLKLPDYQVLNLKVGVDINESFDISLYVNNVFDENPILSFDRERGGRARLGYHVGQPRTWGVTARKRL
jgi:outer membrane receptor protein involved in Fe transport